MKYFMSFCIILAISTLPKISRAQPDDLWRTQLMPGDGHLEGRYDPAAVRVSDLILTADVVLPVGLLIGTDLDRTAGWRALAFGESVAAALILDAAVKYAVRRPRPYLYSSDPGVRAFAASQGRDSRLSFYSGHATTTFSAAVSSAMIFSSRSRDLNARAVVWGLGLALAGATADLRTRAGMHFYSDVVVGAALGAALGVIVPAAQGYGSRPSGREWTAISAGPLIGVLAGELFPVGG